MPGVVTALAGSLTKTIRPVDLASVGELGQRSSVVEARVSQALIEFLGIETPAVMPPAALRALCFGPSLDLLTSSEFPLPAVGIVALDQAWVINRPVAVGSTMTVSVSVASLRRTEEGTSVLVRGIIADEAGVAYAEETVYLAPRAGGSPLDIGELWTFEGLDHRGEYGLSSKGRLKLGQSATVGTRKFTIEDSRRWSKVTGDINPIHMSNLTAKAFGYKHAILHGAAIDAWASACLGLDGSAPCSGRAHFRAPIILPRLIEAVPLSGGDYAAVCAKSGRDLVHFSFRGVSAQADGGEITLPRDNGRTSSTLISQGMMVAAVANNPRTRLSVEQAAPWRKRYRSAMVAVSAKDAPAKGTECARRGLDFLANSVRFSDGRLIGDAQLSAPDGDGDAVVGAGPRVEELRVPIDGRDLSGEELLATLTSWRDEGRVRDDVVDAIGDIIRDPQILDLSRWTFACLGAGAELSPAPLLLDWGAVVAAPAREGSRSIAALAESAPERAGTLLLPPCPMDVVRNPEAAAGWISSLPGRIAIVDTLYAPGNAFLLAAIGADVVERLVCEAREDTALAWYGSPTDAYVLPFPASASLGTGPAAKALAGYAKVRGIPSARVDGVYNGYVGVQGPNYAAAKRVGRWRATVERESGRMVSYNIGPMSTTRSVTDSRPLRAAYAGLSRIGIAPLAPETASALMAALLAWDLKHPEAVTRSDTFLTDNAVDGGLLSSPYEPDSLMGFAVAAGVDRFLR